MSSKGDGNQNSQSAKVLKLGLNISVSGDPGTDFEIVLDDKEQKEEHHKYFDAIEAGGSKTEAPKYEIEKTEEVTDPQSTGAIPKYRSALKKSQSSGSSKMSESESAEDSSPQESNLISKIKSTMEHFEKFSDHIKDIPRLRNRPLATSTPLSDKYNSRSESNLMYMENRPRKFSHLYDFQSRKDYFRSSIKPKPDLFLKPLPGEGYYTRGIYTRYFDLEPYRHYESDISLNKTTESKGIYGKSNYDMEKYELLPEPPVGILKKSDSESGDKQSTSSADSVKDIKIYQSGGILIMQNFKENMDAIEKKEMSEFSAKLIENCNKLKMEVCGFQENKPAIGIGSDETKTSGKMVQFDLSSFDSQKSRFGDSSSNAVKDESSVRMESSESTSDCMKNKDTSPQGTSQSQDFTSLSTQENDSTMSNPPGLSPTYASSKKLEWDSGADIGYLNLDLTKENLSTIEKIVLKGLSSDGISEENVVYEKKPKSHYKSRTRLTLERKPADLIMEEAPEPVKTKEIRSVNQAEKQAEGEKKNEALSKEKAQPSSEEARPSPKKISFKTPPNESRSKELEDKSVNVNTLFDGATFQTPPDQSTPQEIITPSESPVKVTHIRYTHYPPKGRISKHKTRPSNSRLTRTTKKQSLVGSLVNPFDMGIPKKVYKKVEANPALNNVELSREVEEIVVDQRLKIKENVERETSKASEIPIKEKPEEGKTKSRPISASSSSNNTVLPKPDGVGQTEEIKSSERSKCTDKIIQTSDYDCASVGVQAFASQVSSDYDFRSLRRRKKEKRTEVTKEAVNMSSKNIQAFGLNSSLPKQLENPKGAEVLENQHTKSTQYFGGPINSLPNYHSNLVTKPLETCGRAAKVLKTKRNFETEIIRMREENEKNILANDTPIETTKESKRSSNNENKENLISEKSGNSKKSHASRRQSNYSEGENKESEGQGKEKKKSESVEGSEEHRTSDDVSSLVLTSEVLKVHGDCIDRNIIQEKYFQSQLVELEKRKMISRSTSMEIQLQLEAEAKNLVTTACQYSPQSGGTTSGGQYQEPEDESYKENSSRNTRKNKKERTRNKEQNAETGDSLPSSTQTAHSWVPGIPNSGENSTGVGKARSFEYLPGHIYESSGNLREELPSETEQNLITTSSDSDTARGSVSIGDGAKDSEGRQTLILENSTEVSDDSDRLKILKENLAELNVTVTKLREKDAQVQLLTKSLLATLHVENGSGDWSFLGGAEASKTETSDKKDPTDNGPPQVDTLSNEGASRGDALEEEFPISCQTENKSTPSDPGKFYEERKAFEKRMSEEKKCQIKWIENEIYHLNILRRLLEKQSSPVPEKRKQSDVSMTSSDISKTGENYQKNISTDICPRPVTPVYGCTISLSEQPLEKSGRVSSQSNRVSSNNMPIEVNPHSSQYGIALSVSNCSKNWRRVLTLPASVQVSLKDSESPVDCDGERQVKQNKCEDRRKNSLRVEKRSDAQTQYPSSRNHLYTSECIQTEANSLKSKRCRKENCLCINLSDSQSPTTLLSEAKESLKMQSINEDLGTNHTTNSTDPEFLETDNICLSKKTNVEEPDKTNSKFCQTRSSKCQSCTKKNEYSSCIKCHVPCKSNIYLTCDKSSPHSGTCRCSKIQVQKSSNCACQVIKIHRSNCCSPERNFCASCSTKKKTENQSCQTECDSVKKDFSESRKESEEPEVHFYELEGKISCSPERFYDIRKTNFEERKNEPEIPVRDKVPKRSCGGRNDKDKKDDHPRHYFLKIEEKEMDESKEMNQQKKALEVVTITVPVKKAGKCKIYGSNIRQTREVLEENLKLLDQPGCNCCAECTQTRKPTQAYEPPHYSKAEKPESSSRVSGFRKSLECNSYEECSCHSINPERISPPETRYCDRPASDSHEQRCCPGCVCTTRNSPPSREYDSHKKRGYAEAREFCEEKRSPEVDWCSDLRGSRHQGLNSESDRNNTDYFNYNKREFMTKSELRKEEEKKQKVFQPSLQECLSSNRPDFFNSAERRRQIISERSKERVRKHNNRMDCLIKMMQQCNKDEVPSNEGCKRLFTSVQMKEQTMKRYKNLPEVTGKIANDRKKEEYRTNRLMADIFAKKLQNEALKGHINLSNSESVLYTI